MYVNGPLFAQNYFWHIYVVNDTVYFTHLRRPQFTNSIEFHQFGDKQWKFIFIVFTSQLQIFQLDIWSWPLRHINVPGVILFCGRRSNQVFDSLRKCVLDALYFTPKFLITCQIVILQTYDSYNFKHQ